MSHFYPQGCNLYFIFIARIDEILITSLTRRVSWTPFRNRGPQ